MSVQNVCLFIFVFLNVNIHFFFLSFAAIQVFSFWSRFTIHVRLTRFSHLIANWIWMMICSARMPTNRREWLNTHTNGQEWEQLILLRLLFHSLTDRPHKIAKYDIDLFTRSRSVIRSFIHLFCLYAMLFGHLALFRVLTYNLISKQQTSVAVDTKQCKY